MPSEKSESGFSMARTENFALAHKGRKDDLQQILIQEYRLWGVELSWKAVRAGLI